MSNETKQTNNNEHVDGVTNSVQRSDKNDELVEKFLCLQKKFIGFGGDGTSEAREWNEFIKQYPQDSILRISAYQIPRINCFFSLEGWKFPFKVKLSGKFEYVNFDNSKFENEFDSSHAEFLECAFRRAIFFERANFNFSKFSKKACFDGAFFKKDAHFFYVKVSGEMTFCGANFGGEAVFAEIEFGKDFDNTLLMDGAKFSEKVSLINFNSESKKYEGSLKSFSLNRAIFNAPTAIDFKLEKCPDFSKCSFLNKVFIEESWQIDKKKLTEYDESKFRFLKQYFAEQGNHFKEQEYFSYEMTAREKKLDVDGGSDWLLFKAYKHLSDFGMSAFLPFSWLCFFCSVFFIISLFFGCDTWSGLTNSVVRTLNPLAKFECSAQIASDSFVFAPEYFLEIFRIESQPLVISSGLRIVSAFQSVINATLIFLFILGIRNKFKIK